LTLSDALREQRCVSPTAKTRASRCVVWCTSVVSVSAHRPAGALVIKHACQFQGGALMSSLSEPGKVSCQARECDEFIVRPYRRAAGRGPESICARLFQARTRRQSSLIPRRSLRRPTCAQCCVGKASSAQQDSHA